MTLLPPPWTAAFDAELRALAEQVVVGKGPARLCAWQQLLVRAAKERLRVAFRAQRERFGLDAEAVR